MNVDRTYQTDIRQYENIRNNAVNIFSK